MTAYRINDHHATASYALAVLAAIADNQYPIMTGETPAEYAQRHLDAMVAEGSIRVDEDKP
jgi:hypothetical protein